MAPSQPASQPPTDSNEARFSGIPDLPLLFLVFALARAFENGEPGLLGVGNGKRLQLHG